MPLPPAVIWSVVVPPTAIAIFIVFIDDLILWRPPGAGLKEIVWMVGVPLISHAAALLWFRRFRGLGALESRERIAEGGRLGARIAASLGVLAGSPVWIGPAFWHVVSGTPYDPLWCVFCLAAVVGLSSPIGRWLGVHLATRLVAQSRPA